MDSATSAGVVRPAWRRRWPERIPYAAAAWSLLYGGLGLYWTMRGGGFPFGSDNDPGAHLSALGSARREILAPAITALGAIGAVAAVLMARGSAGTRRAPLIAFGWTAAIGLAVVIPDFRVLVIVAYAPILLLGAPFDWPAGARLSEAIPWPVVNQVICMAGGLLWGATTLAYQRRTRGSCGHCGRTNTDSGWSAEETMRRGRRAVAIAILVPLVYAASRWAWALGFPLGLDETFYREGRESGLWWIGAALATVALAGSLLTLGLVQPWGEVFPRWLPVLAGRAVPRPLVLVPASIVAVIVTSAGLMFVRFTISGTFRLGEHPVTLTENVGALVPELLWPVWGAALAVAALAYYYRTRGRCTFCGRK